MITTRISKMNPVCFKLMMFMLCMLLRVVYGEQEMMCIAKEREALLKFKAALVLHNGMLSSWTTPNCCQWEGIRCSNLTTHIISIDLRGEFHYVFQRYHEISDRYISGEIHKALMELRQLQYLNLSSNSFPYKGIPEFLGSLRNLKYLDLSSCGFGGEIPSQFGSLSHLKYLNLASNSLEGSIPRQLGYLSQLQHLDLRSNSFYGNIPSQLGNLPQLQHLDLRGNSFKGNIASELGNLSQLQYLDLRYNYFEANIPSQLGNLSQLTKFYFGGYYDTLKIAHGGQWLSNLISLTHLYIYSVSNLYPSHSWLQLITKLPKLRELSLVRCSLSDHFILSSTTPSNFNSSTSLSLLDLSFNTFMSPMVFQWVSNITSNLIELDLSGNLLKGSTSSHFGMVMNSLRHLDLSSNRFKGEDLKSFMNACTLHSLNMHGNNLTEDLPSILDHLSSGCVRHSLKELDLTDNHITGTLPMLSVFSSLKTLFLDSNQLSGMISKDIILPPQLESLSIQRNSFKGGIPKSFGNACALRSLDLSNNNLNKDLPMIIHHLSGCARHSLKVLYLRGNQISGTFPDLSIFLALKILDLSGNKLSGRIPETTKLPPLLEVLSITSNTLKGGIPKSFGNACALSSLDMSYNSLSEDFPMIMHNLSGCARNSLKKLSLYGNKINGMLVDFSMFSTLQELDLSENQLNGKILEGFKFPSNLEFFSVRTNTLEGGIPKAFGNACSLYFLDMSNNSFSGEFSMIIHHLSACTRYSLEELHLGMNEINGTLPDLSTFTSLKGLYLFENKLNGDVKDIQFPSQLRILNLQSNFLKGVFTDYHFANMSKLLDLQLSDNSLTLKFTENWVPPFQLLEVGLRSCKLGPTFSKWLQTQNKLYDIDISNASISDIVPQWFWANLSLQRWIRVNISYNNLRGTIPSFPQKYYFDSISLASNQFEGSIPLFLRDSTLLDLSKNKFSDSLSFLCGNGTIQNLYQLDLSNNQLSGQIPDCWGHLSSLAYLDLSHNNFSGKIPTSIGLLLDLQALLLRDNNLIEGIPLSLRNCTKLTMLDMSGNKLSGFVPDWIGTKKGLQALSLRRNQFYGSLPLQICYLRNIQLLDLSLNNLSGKIPKCIKNFTSMAQTTSSIRGHWYPFNTSYVSGNQSYDLNTLLMWKGSEQMFKNKGLSLLKSIDLSSNCFSKEIPLEIEKLSGLISLNLSRNNLIGKIPPNIGNLALLDSLDLSRNQLVGSIPRSLSQIFRLGVLDLSHNHLTRRIPSSTQLQSFGTSSYEDNLDLCGNPLKKMCINIGSTQKPNVEVHEDEYSFFNNDFFISMGLGFVISFSMVFGSILFKHSWRHAYFNFLNNLANNIYVKVAILVKVVKVDKN